MKRLSLIMHATAVAAIFAPFSCYALTTPIESPEDSHIRVVNYNRNNMVLVKMAYGERTHIELGKGEKVTYVSTGDDPAWDIGPSKNIQNHLFIKPVGVNPTTNMVVITNKRTYNLKIELVRKKDDYYADLLYVYPDEATKKEQTEILKKRLDDAVAGNDPRASDNTNYWAQGSTSLTPSRAWDDGRFTYLAFPAGADLPAMYNVGDDGKEILVNPSVDAKTGVVSITFLAKHLVLREGDKLVTCVYNRSYKGPGIGSPSGTIDSGIYRTVKGKAE